MPQPTNGTDAPGSERSGVSGQQAGAGSDRSEPSAAERAGEGEAGASTATGSGARSTRARATSAGSGRSTRARSTSAGSARATRAPSASARSAGAAGRAGGRSTGSASGAARSAGAAGRSRGTSSSARSAGASGRAGADSSQGSAGGAGDAAAEQRLDALAQRLRRLNERIIEAGRDAGETTLASYEKALKAIASSIERGPGSSDIDWIATIANVQAKFIRELTSAWAAAARGLLKK